MRAGNVSVTDIYNCSEVELRTMVERDRCLRAIRMGCSPRDIALRTPSNDTSGIVECGGTFRFTLIIDRTVSAELFAPMRIWLVQGGNPRGVLLLLRIFSYARRMREKELTVCKLSLRRSKKLPAGQRNIVRGVLVKGASQSDMARELGVSRAAVSKQLSTAVRKIRAAIRDESKETKNTTTSSVCERKEH